MKEKLYQEYAFKIDYLTYKKNHIFFNVDNQKYLIVKTDLGEFELERLNTIVNYLDKYGIYFHQLLFNKHGSLFEFGNNKYVVLKLRINVERRINIYDIINLMAIPVEIESKNLMEMKIDFLEQYLANYEDLEFENFNYFLGLAENSISLFNLLNTNNKSYINHRRIYFNTTTIDFYNPLNIVLDYSGRDLSEYAKSLFINGDDKIIEFLNFLKVEDWYSYFARLMFPSFYFDLIDSYVNNNLKPNKKRISYLANSFEKKIRETYNYVSSRINMPYIEWLSNVNNF